MIAFVRVISIFGVNYLCIYIYINHKMIDVDIY